MMPTHRSMLPFCEFVLYADFIQNYRSNLYLLKVLSMLKIATVFYVTCMLCIQSSYGQANSRAMAFSFFAIGDMPYGGPESEVEFERLITTLNKEKHAFTIHVGDFKSGSMLCSNEYYTRMLGYFGQFSKPMIYTPGDNEWTDCNRPACGSYDPEERLQYLRQHFFATTKSFGRQPLDLVSQRNSGGFEKFAENNRWEYGNILFTTVHVIGSNNNFSPATNNTREFYERDSANIYWLQETFRQAAIHKNAGIVIALQADMFYRNEEHTGFIHTIDVLRKLTVEFNKPVLLINGDSHHYLIDKPLAYLTDTKSKHVVPNFTRLQVFGETDMHAVRVSVNPANPYLFEISPFFIQGN